MAYGNWGGTVYKDGEQKVDWEDATPYKETELQSGYHQAFFRSEETGYNPHHSVLGDKDMRLCGYKSYPVLFFKGEKIDIDQYGTEKDSYWGGDTFTAWEGNIEGYEFSCHREEDPESVVLELIQPDGSKWNAHCGYMLGNAGY